MEHHFVAGDIRVISATPTLAMGMNLPARNVFLPADKWTYLKRYRDWCKVELSKSEYENMSGRAGRYSLTEGFGRSLLVTSSPFEAKTWMDVFVDSDFEAIEPTLKDTPLAVHVLDLLASGLVASADEAAELLLRSFTGQTWWKLKLSQDEFRAELDKAIDECRAAGLLKELREAGRPVRLKPTPLGKVCAGTGLSIDTAAALARWLRATEDLTIAPLDVLTALSCTPDGDECYLIDGRDVWLPNQPFRILCLLASQHCNDPCSWIHVSEFGLSSSPHRAISRLRKFLVPYPGPGGNGWIENDGHGGYRLSERVAGSWEDDTFAREHPELADMVSSLCSS